MVKRFIRAMEVSPRVITEGRLSRLLVSNSSVGVTAFSMGLNITQPGTGMRPPHVHERESETMYVTQGRVKFILGEEEYICDPDCFVHVPPGVPHGYENLGDVESKFLWIYQPPLPEQQ